MDAGRGLIDDRPRASSLENETPDAHRRKLHRFRPKSGLALLSVQAYFHEMNLELSLEGMNRILVKQVHELGEWIGFETRNKYQITDEKGHPIGFAAEQQKGILGFLLRQYLGHWRTFEVHFFTPDRRIALVGRHPFRWFFERIELWDADGSSLGAIQKRFALFSKKFDVEDARGGVLLQVSSPIWRVWTFVFLRRGREAARVTKKWSGLLSEAFTDKDHFLIEFKDAEMETTERRLVMASAVFIDLLYFERHRK
jgi:uncharacterized protein YxjI